MAYTKTNWQDNVTPVSAQNMNKIEQGIEDAHNSLEEAERNLDNINNKIYGMAEYTDTIPVSTTIQKTIPLGGEYNQGIAVVCRRYSTNNAYPYGIMVFFGKDNLKTKALARYDYSGTLSSGAWIREKAGKIIGVHPDNSNFYLGTNILASNKLLELREFYINGTDLVIEFHNTYTSDQTLGVYVFWEVWK